MTVSKKQLNYLRDYGSTKTVKELSRELGLTKGEVRRALEELRRKGQIKAEPPPPPAPPVLDEKVLLVKNDYLWAALVGVISLIIYLLTVAPDVTGEDSGELVTAAYTFGVAHPSGYPIWCILGKIFTTLLPVGSIAFRINFMSSFFAAGTVFFLFLIILKIMGNKVIAAGTALVFAFTPQFWSQGVIAEVYTLNACFVAACIFLLLLWDEKRSDRLLYVLALVAGLGCTNHHTMIPLALLFAVYVVVKGKRSVLQRKVAGISVLLFVAALSLYLYIPLRARANPYINWGNPQTIGGMVDHVMRKQYSAPEARPGAQSEDERSWGKFGRQIGVYAQGYVEQFTWLLFWIPILGAWLLYREKRVEFYFLLGIFLLTSVGLIVFTNFKLEREHIFANKIFFIPSYLVATICMSIGLLWLWKVLSAKVNWKAIGVVAASVAIVLPVINLFDNYHENDKSRYYYAYDLGKATLDTMDENAIFFPSGDHTTFPLMYFQGVHGMRPDVTIADKYGYFEKDLYQELIEQKKKAGGDPDKISRREIERHIILNNQDRPVYFYVKRDMSDLRGFAQIPEGLLFRLVRKVDLRKYKKKVSEEFWRSYRFRYFEDPRVVKDFTADVIISDYHYARARCYFEEGDMEKGLAEIEKVQEPAEGFKEVFNNLANMLAERGLFKQAIKLYEKALSYNPNYLMAIRNLVKVYRQTNDYENCIKYINRALEINRYDFDTHIELAQLYAGKKEFDKAIAKLEKIIKMFPTHYLPYRLLGFIYLNEKKDEEKAFALFRQSLELNPDQPYLKGLLARKKKPEEPKDLPDKPKKDHKAPTPEDMEPKIPKPKLPKIPKPIPKVPKPKIPRPKLPVPPRRRR